MKYISILYFTYDMLFVLIRYQMKCLDLNEMQKQRFCNNCLKFLVMVTMEFASLIYTNQSESEGTSLSRGNE